MGPNKIDRPPIDPAALATWFAQGVRSKLDALEKEGGAQNYEVLSGRLIERSGPTQAISQFIIADGTRIPEDATGRLKTDVDDYIASVIGQQGNLIHLQIESKALPLHGITRATLIIDDTALLRRLAEVLEEIATTPTTVGPLATTVFHPWDLRKYTESILNLDSRRIEISPVFAIISKCDRIGGSHYD